MAQYDVYANPVKSERERYPYVIDMQNALYDQMQTRWVMPLAQTMLAKRTPQNLSPTVFVEGNAYYAMPTLTAPFFLRALGKPVSNVASQSLSLVSAIDAVMSGY